MIAHRGARRPMITPPNLVRLAAAAVATAVLLAVCGGSRADQQADASARGAGELPFANTSAGTRPDAAGWRTVFSDDFSGTALDSGKWRTREQPRTAQRRCANPGKGMVEVRDGTVVLGVKQVGKVTKACPHGVWKNAMIGTGEVTKPGFATSYGLFAARVKFQRGQGQHGSFWIQGTGPTAAEIDVAEYFGDGHADGGTSNVIHQTKADGKLVSAGGRRPEVPAALGKGQTPASGWHVWSVEWSPKGYVFRLDDRVTFRTSRNKASADEFMVLSLLTSDFELPYLENTRSKMRVDWVRVWKRD